MVKSRMKGTASIWPRSSRKTNVVTSSRPMDGAAVVSQSSTSNSNGTGLMLFWPRPEHLTPMPTVEITSSRPTEPCSIGAGRHATTRWSSAISPTWSARYSRRARHQESNPVFARAEVALPAGQANGLSLAATNGWTETTDADQPSACERSASTRTESGFDEGLRPGATGEVWRGEHGTILGTFSGGGGPARGVPGRENDEVGDHYLLRRR